MIFVDEFGALSTVLTLVFATAVLLLLFKPSSTKNKKEKKLNPLDHKELLEKRLSEFKPAPLTEPLNDFDKLNLQGVDKYQVASKPDRIITLVSNGEKIELLNFGTVDFLGSATDPDITGKIAVDALNHYGVGSCGPRSFYGTFDVHLLLEKKLAEWFGTEGALVYSDSFSTMPGVLGAFVEKTDVIFADEAVNQSIRNGVLLTRAKVVFYKHRDYEDCERKMTEIEKTKGKKQRLFLVSDAIFRTTGKVCDLKKLIKLRNKFKARLLLDESLSVGVLGPTGRGLWEEEGVNVESVDFLCGSLDNVFATVGGYCVANQVINTHQRIAGAGYVFSAAVAPVLSVTATASIQRIIDSSNDQSNKTDWLCSKLRKNIQLFHEKFGRNNKIKEYFQTSSSRLSPICHVCLKAEEPKLKQYKQIREICEMFIKDGLFVVATAQTPHEQQVSWLKPSIKLSFSVKHSQQDIERLIQQFEEVAKSQMN